MVRCAAQISAAPTSLNLHDPQPLRGANIGFADIISRAQGEGSRTAGLSCSDSGERWLMGEGRPHQGAESGEVVGVELDVGVGEDEQVAAALRSAGLAGGGDGSGRIEDDGVGWSEA